MKRYIRWFSEIGLADLASVGGKNASLGEMYRELTAQGIRVPNGFAVTADGYRAFLSQGNLGERLRRELDGLDTRDIEGLRRRGAAVRQALLDTPLPDELAAEIVAAYRELSPVSRARRRRPQQRHSGGSAGGELRRTAGVFPQRPGRDSAAGLQPTLLRVALQGPRNLVPS